MLHKSYRNYLLLMPLLLCLVLAGVPATAQKQKTKKDKQEALDTIKSSVFSGLKWRSIGPAFASGRIADFAVNPANPSEYYVGVASGHIWKTLNNGTTFSPVFDNHGAYAIGALCMDPNNSNVVWAGTGENNHQRALGYGNGVYKTEDGGKSWKNMGLKDSRQIGKILIDPRNSNIVFVAAEGSTWGPGGDRGLYKTTDGGKTWERVLFISENTGVNNIVFDPLNPDVIYATSEQRRRHVYSKIGGGPESAVHKSSDAGKTWQKLTKGLPSGHVGGMGIAVTPLNPDIVYVIAEAAEDKGGFFRSTDRGASFEKMNSYTASGQYYNVIFCDPVNPDKVFSMDVVSKVTYDGGKTWNNLSTNKRHVDDHALWIDPRNTSHWMIGGDGGIYETWDDGQHYVFKTNLPVTQYYRVNVDDSKPFYWVYGGTQDNNSQGGPSRNTNRDGVGSHEWVVTLGGDGFWQAIEPGNPDIVYSAYQYGNIFRYDKRSAERIKIKPEPRKHELTYRWNWDAPFILSHHSPTRLYMGANKLFCSNDRGNTWEVISEDLTRNEDRNQFKVMDKFWPSNAVAKDVSTSLWGTIVSLAESPLKAGLIYIGTDDGLIQVTEDDGRTWHKMSQFPGVPEFTYVSDIFPSRFDENVAFATFNNLKSDDFKAYVLKTSDKGRTWSSIASNLPNETIHTIAQDFINSDLLFVGTEFCFYVSVDGGKFWVKFNAGLPDIAVKDIAIQERENDLVIATFGRGFYILDNYSPLRQINAEKLKNLKTILFPVKDALIYVEEGGRYGTGSTPFLATNPPFGATFTYYINEVPKTLKQQRLKKEKDLFDKSLPIPQPTKEILDAEENEMAPYLVFTIRDERGEVARKLYEEAKEGINRMNWRLRYENPVAQASEKASFKSAGSGQDGAMALPGKYTVSMELVHDGKVTESNDAVAFNAVVLNNTTLPAENREELVTFSLKVADLRRVSDGAQRFASDLKNRNENVRQALHYMINVPADMVAITRSIAEALKVVEFTFNGTKAQASSEEVPPEPVSLNQRMGAVMSSLWSSTATPTQTMRLNYEIVREELPPVLDELRRMAIELKQIEDRMDALNAPYTPGRLPDLR
ncbi:MAG: YCF48-related protein [Bacteroidales bacterium]|nr:YCF48-related protein [Bacteroidales bacterium]MDZ4204076.1 YCF48-related protein [Bacteroidales bacterium]